MGVNIGDLFTIGFDSKGLKEFAEKLKKTKKELDETEDKIEKMEQAQENLTSATDKATKSEEKNKKALENTGDELEETKEKAQELKKEIESMSNSTSGQVLKLQNNFTKLAGTIGKLTILGLSLKQSLDLYEKGEQLDLLSKKTGIAVEQIQKLGSVVTRFGGSTEDITSSLQALNTNEGRQKAVSMGVAISNNPEKTLENIARKMETLKSDVQKFQFAESLGLDEGTTRLLIEGVQRYREELKRTDKYKLYAKEDIERMRDYRQVQADIKQNVSDIQGTIAKTLLPGMIKFNKTIRSVSDWAVEHEGAVKIATIFVVITTAIKGTIAALKALKAVGTTAFGWALVITGVIAYLQDLYTFINGGESVLGKLWESWGYDLEQIRHGFEVWGERIKRWWNNFLSFFDKNRTFQIDPIQESVIKPLNIKDIEKYNKNRLNKENEDLSKSLEGRELTISAGRKNIFTAVSDYIATKNALNNARYTINKANNNPLNSVPQGAIQNYNSTISRNENNNQNAKNINTANNNQRTTNIGTINIQTQATSGAEVARDIQNISQFDDGIVA